MSVRRRSSVVAATLALSAMLAVCACTGSDTAGPSASPATGAPSSATAGAPTTARRPPSTIAAPPVNTCTTPKPYTPSATPLSLTSGGAARPYLLSVPPGYDGSKGTPLILDFHGFTLTKEIQSALGMVPPKGAAAGMIVATPDAIGSLRSWNMFKVDQEPDDFAFVDDLLDELSEKLCIDPNRIYATGISNGSAFSALLACTPPYRFAAIGMVGATVGSACPDDVRIPVIAFHGTADPVVPYTGGTVNSPAALGRDAPAAEQAIKEWAEHDGCRTTPDEQKKPTYRRLDFPDCASGENVTLYALQGGGHTWPGGLNVQQLGIGTFGSTNVDVDATALMLDFFKAHPRANR